MNRLFAAALEVQSFCVARRWQLAVIGGLAVQRWGEPRQTRDVDVTLLTGMGGEEAFIDALLSHFRPRLPEARRFALERRVLLLETQAGIAGRPQDWLDVEGVLVRQGASLDRALVLNELRPLLDLKEDAEAEATLQRLFAKHRR